MGTSDGHGMAGGQDHSQLCASILSVFYPKSLQCLAGKETLSYEFFKTCLGSFGRGMFELQIRVLFDEVSELVSKHLKKWDSSSSESGTFFNTITGGGAAVGGGGADVKP